MPPVAGDPACVPVNCAVPPTLTEDCDAVTRTRAWPAVVGDATEHPSTLLMTIPSELAMMQRLPSFLVDRAMRPKSTDILVAPAEGIVGWAWVLEQTGKK